LVKPIISIPLLILVTLVIFILNTPTVSTGLSNSFVSITSNKDHFSPGEKIILSGEIRNGSMPVRNQPVVIDVMDKDKVLYHLTSNTDNIGAFNFSSIVVPYETIATVTARALTSQNNSNSETLTLSIVNEKWGLLVPILFIIITVAFLLLFSPKYQKIALLGGLTSTSIGYFFLYYLSPLDTAGNTAISVALLAPLATYVFDSLTKRKEASALLESSVGEYRKAHLTQEVEGLANIFEELDLHQSIFKAKYDIVQNKLVKVKYDQSKKAGTMANLPGLRINQYYYYLEYYNRFLDAKINRLGDLQDEQKYADFSSCFQELKDAYSKLNQILYVNVLYDVGEIQSRFLSFPTVEFPIRTSGPLRDRLIKANVPQKELQDSRIYKPENAIKLMRVIAPEFSTAYAELESAIQKLLEFTLT
jgi:hypothetical protein